MEGMILLTCSLEGPLLIISNSVLSKTFNTSATLHTKKQPFTQCVPCVPGTLLDVRSKAKHKPDKITAL